MTKLICIGIQQLNPKLTTNNVIFATQKPHAMIHVFKNVFPPNCANTPETNAGNKQQSTTPRPGNARTMIKTIYCCKTKRIKHGGSKTKRTTICNTTSGQRPDHDANKLMLKKTKLNNGKTHSCFRLWKIARRITNHLQTRNVCKQKRAPK